MTDFSLALGGGSLRGAAHIGVLQVLLENGFEPELVVGTSAGSLVGALYAAGYKPPEITGMMLKEMQKLPDPKLEPEDKALALGRGLPLGLIPGYFIERLLANALGNIHFDELRRPLAVVAANLYNGEVVVFTSGKQIPDQQSKSFRYISGVMVQEAVRASIAIPGVFQPKEIFKMTLVDGGVVSNVPADVAKSLGKGKVIAVDLGFAVEQTKPFTNLIQVLLQTYDIMGQRVSNMVTGQYSDLTIKPRVPNATLWDFAKIPGFVKQGRLETQKQLKQIKTLLQ